MFSLNVRFHKNEILTSINLLPVSKPVIAVAVLIGNPASNRLKYGPPIKAFEGDNLHSGRIVLLSTLTTVQITLRQNNAAGGVGG